MKAIFCERHLFTVLYAKYLFRLFFIAKDYSPPRLWFCTSPAIFKASISSQKVKAS